MRAFVFTDKALASQARRFVWLEIDTEKAQNAAFRKQFTVQALPTFFVIDPASEKVVLRWVGGATVPQLQKLLDDGRAAVAGAGKPVATAKKTDSPSARADAAVARADALYGEAKNHEAAAAYEEALAAAPADWPQYGRTVESLLFALSSDDQYEKAATLSRDAFPKLRRTGAAANVAVTGLDAALQLPAEHAGRKTLVETLEANARAVAEDASVPIADDDRSGVFMALRSAREDAKDSTGARELTARWSSFLDGAAARASNPEGRTVFDSHRMTAYLELGQPEKAIAMLEQSERDLPADYNPPARLAYTYKSMQRWDEALAASDRALAKAYGPRTLNVLQVRADIYAGKGDVAAARKTLEDALQIAEALPPGQRSEGQIANLKKKLDALGKS